MINIIYEDNHLLVVEKPINVIVQEDNTNDKDLLSMLKEYLKEKYGKKEIYERRLPRTSTKVRFIFNLRLIIRLLRLPTIRVTLFASVRQAHSDLRVRESLPRSQRSRRAKRQRSPQKSMVLRV